MGEQILGVFFIIYSTLFYLLLGYLLFIIIYLLLVKVQPALTQSMKILVGLTVLTNWKRAQQGGRGGRGETRSTLEAQGAQKRCARAELCHEPTYSSHHRGWEASSPALPHPTLLQTQSIENKQSTNKSN